MTWITVSRISTAPCGVTEDSCAPAAKKKSICKPFLKDLTFTDMEISCDLWEMETHTKKKRKKEKKDERKAREGNMKGRRG